MFGLPMTFGNDIELKIEDINVSSINKLKKSGLIYEIKKDEIGKKD